MKTRKFAVIVLVGLTALASGFLIGLTPVLALADVPPVTPTVPEKGLTDVPCKENSDCVLLNYRWNTAKHPCCAVTDTGEEVSPLCQNCWEKYFRSHMCDQELGLCRYEDEHQMNIIVFPCEPCPYGCSNGACLPEPEVTTWSTATADVSVQVHALMLINGQCVEVGLDGIGIRLTECDQPELQTAGKSGEGHWHFWPGYGNGTHQIQWWDGDAQLWRLLLDEIGEPLSFHGSQLQLGETRRLGPVILWDTCR